MLLSIASDLDYRSHLRFDLSSLDSSQKVRLASKSFKSALHKLKKLNVDLVSSLLFPLYSSTGRPANDPSVYIRSFILMQHLGFSSLSFWCSLVNSDSLLLFLIGTSKLPSASSHYDFINRISHVDPHNSDLLPKSKNFNSSSKPKKGEKLVNFSNDDAASLVDAYSVNPVWDNERTSFTLQAFFNAIVVIPSHDLGLIDSDNLVLSGDGSSLHIHASSAGHTVIRDDSVLNTHRYSSPEADIGWDSDLNSFYFGFTLYNISNHNARFNIDLPTFISIEKASRHDALTAISASAQFFNMTPDLHPRFMCFDSASDNYPTHLFLRSHNIISIIDINHRRKDKNPFSAYEHLSSNGIPICMNNIEMIYNGYEAKKYRLKFRCPLAMGKIHSCPHKAQCCPTSDYGKIRYIKESDDIKLFGPVPYKSPKWKEIYKNRTCTERMNNRILNDYHLHNMHIRNQSKFLFFAIFAAINIHLDAQIKLFPEI